MKTAKEIEKLAFDTILSEQGKLGFVVGYNFCQKDISQEFYDKKYTEKQLLDAMSFAECYIIEHDKPLFLKSDGKPTPDCLEYINSLNK